LPVHPVILVGILHDDSTHWWKLHQIHCHKPRFLYLELQIPACLSCYATLFLFGLFDAYHPPAIGAMLTYLIDTGFDDLSILIYVPLAVIFLLATIKSYIYMNHSDEFKWKNIGKEFRSDYRKINKAALESASRKKTIQIVKNLHREEVDTTIIAKVTKMSKDEIRALISDK